MRREREEIDTSRLRYFVDRKEDKESGIKEGAWMYWLNDAKEIVAMKRLEGKEIYNKRSKRYESFIYE